MKGLGARILAACVMAMTPAAVVTRFSAARGPQYPGPAPITIDYPLEGSIFPPEITAPTFLWHDPAETATVWLIEAAFGDGVPEFG